MSPSLSQHQDELHRMCRRFRVRRSELFGSAVTGRERAGYRNLDVLVEFAPLAPGTYADTYFGLLDALTSLPGRPANLVVAESNQNPYFRQAVEQTKVLAFAS